MNGQRPLKIFMNYDPHAFIARSPINREQFKNLKSEKSRAKKNSSSYRNILVEGGKIPYC
tara:strand:- start:6240 stop:6419 length:180 start_codon:yes stop_codon:yes gene_type:complete